MDAQRDRDERDRAMVAEEHSKRLVVAGRTTGETGAPIVLLDGLGASSRTVYTAPGGAA